MRSRREVESEREHVRRWDELSQSLGEASAPAEVTGALISALATAFPRACLIVALRGRGPAAGSSISAVRPGDDGPSVRRDDPIALELARLAYDRARRSWRRATRPPSTSSCRGMDDELAAQVGSLYALPLLTPLGPRRSGR